jgi:CMP-N-acetylneuraminic acid synthetase
MHVLGIVPARGGSKGIRRKNLRNLGGKPLLYYTAVAALASRRLSRVVLSTEDEEIAEVGRQYGLETPFQRPPQLALDDTPTLEVVQHAVRELEAVGDVYEAICILQPTCPFRRPEYIDHCIDLLAQKKLDAVVTVLPVPVKYNPNWVFLRDGDDLLRLSTGASEPIPRRQVLPPAYHREGSVYVVTRDVLVEKNSLYGDRLCGYEVDPNECVNIDSLADWQQAESLLSEQFCRAMEDMAQLAASSH